MTEIPEVHPLNIALKYNPPMLILHYYLGANKEIEFAQQVNILPHSKATASQYVEELYRAEPLYFNPNELSKAQVSIWPKFIGGKARAASLGKQRQKSWWI